ncbi:MAG: pyridoxamine kinase [Lachnospiraceae bacterium]|nr:pyridoxamine kinase [Lachnospiraceae bacterium]
MKRILTIQDISCFGKCSLTVALPLLSAMGIETVILPTAVLSTHTMFKGFTCRDLSDELKPITEHWKKEGITFDAICTGYLGTEEEIDTVIDIIQTFRNENTLVFVDPAMGDNGKLYPAFDAHYAKKNADLCAVADIADPNITEGSYLTGLAYRESYTEDYVKEMLKALASLGTKTPILTGVALSEGKTGAMGYDTANDEFFFYQNERIPASYHGTGDIFSSVLAGAFVLGIDRTDALKIAADYTADTIAKTLKDPADPWYGVNFEAAIPDLIDSLKAVKRQEAD